MDLVSARGDKTLLEKSRTAAQHQLVDAQFALVTVEGDRDEYLRRLGFEEQRYSSLEALLCGPRSR